LIAGLVIYFLYGAQHSEITRAQTSQG
jgi:hypothetical protein